jgi:(E)-4-hydroxy-3-methylbut-2-enyl-diphosphate synthase
LPGTFEDPVAPVYVDGKLAVTLRGDTIVAEFKEILDRYIESHYGQQAKTGEWVGSR